MRTFLAKTKHSDVLFDHISLVYHSGAHNSHGNTDPIDDV